MGVIFANVVSTPATLSPPVTTLFHNSAITNPKAAASDVEMVLRTSPIEIFLSSAMEVPQSGMGEGNLRPTLGPFDDPSPSRPPECPRAGPSDTGRPGPSRGTLPCPRWSAERPSPRRGPPFQ